MSYQVLYISYDGMTDPLGQSQVLPYLTELSKSGYSFTILSFEKKKRYQAGKGIVEKIVQDASIKWVPLFFTSKPPILSKMYDRWRLLRKAFQLQHQSKFDIIHCRSYIAAEAGLRLKKKTGSKFLFDMRGFWADEKKDGEAWNQKNILFKKIYRHYKKKEAQFISQADCIISLTEAGHNEIMKWPSYNPAIPINVSPCCADMDHFTVTTEQEKIKGCQLLEIPQDKLIISYLGSVGAWYMLDEMLELFSLIKKKHAGALFLFITHSDPAIILLKLEKYGLTESDIKICEATRNQVPVFMKASDINISFIKPVYSKISSSPTKLGEVLVMGIPVIVNTGVGDIDAIIASTGSGIVLKAFNEAEYARAVESISVLLQKQPGEIRRKAEEIFSLKIGVKKYKQSYEIALKGKAQ